MKPGFILIGFFIILSGFAQDTTYFGINFMKNEANPFLGYYTKGTFHKEILDSTITFDEIKEKFNSIANKFKKSNIFGGANTESIKLSVRIDSIMEMNGDMYESLYRVTVNPISDTVKPVLFNSMNERFKVLKTEKIKQFTEEELLLFNKIANEEYHKALVEKNSFDIPDSIAIHTPTGIKVMNTNTPISITIPIDLYYFEPKTHNVAYSDDRAQVYLSYDQRTSSVLFKSFGHPEWSPDADKVRIVTPLLYFQMPPDPKTYILIDYSGGWESWIYAIMDAISCEICITTY